VGMWLEGGCSWDKYVEVRTYRLCVWGWVLEEKLESAAAHCAAPVFAVGGGKRNQCEMVFYEQGKLRFCFRGPGVQNMRLLVLCFQRQTLPLALAR
jgi:hypothetical protein